MMTPYICENTLVKNQYGREGMVLSIDRKNKIAVMQAANSIWTEQVNHLIVISYKGVQ